MSSQFAAIVIFDDPECSGAARYFADRSEQMLSAQGAARPSTEIVLAGANAATSHGDALVEALRQLVNFRTSDITVVALLKDAQAAAACQRIRELCAETRPPITECHIATHLASFRDMRLVIDNLVRRFHAAVQPKEQQQQP
jgi:hypothetical protein